MGPQDRDLEHLDDELPINVLPYSNEEFFPQAPTAEELAIHRLAHAEITDAARKHRLPRRAFLRTGAAAAITMSAINRVMGGGYAIADPSKACEELNYPGTQLQNEPGEFIMDVQTHHVDSGGTWRITNPGEHAFFAAIWAQSGCGEADRVECLGRFHYLKELFLDSATNVTVLSAVPYQPNGQPLPIEKAAETCGIVQSISGGTLRAVMHRFVMPNRGSMGHASDRLLGSAGVYPAFMKEEFDLMEYTAAAFPQYLRAWKVYNPWGDVPNTSGWWFDDPAGLKFLEKVQDLGNRYPVPKLVAAHKGFALPSFDQEKAATRDVGVVAPMFQDVSFIIYHSGYDGDSVGIGGPLNQGTSTVGPYPLDIAPNGDWRLGAGSEANVRSIDRGVDNFIRALRENGWSARHFAPGGSPGTPLRAGDGEDGKHANVPNVYAELGSVWSAVQRNPNRASYLLGKLIYYVGARQIVWGTDSLWGGSPHGQIITFRHFQMTQAIKDLYNLPYGLDGDVDDPTQPARSPAHTIRNAILGRNAARAYGIDPDAHLEAMSCDDVQRVRDAYGANPFVPRPNAVRGPRTRRELIASLREDPWHQGARAAQNEKGFMRTLR